MNYIYLFTFPNGKHYVGQTNNFQKRLWSYPSASRRDPNMLISRGINKYGWENIKKEVLLTIEDDFLADFFERAFISGFDSAENGYNTELGGKVNKTISEETRRVSSLAHLGFQHTEETKKKISEALKLRIRKPESHRKISDTLMGHSFSKETLEKMSRTKKEKFRLGICKPSRMVPVKAIGKNNEELVFESINDAARKLNLDVQNIHRSLHGKRYACGGYKWQKLSEVA